MKHIFRVLGLITVLSFLFTGCTTSPATYTSGTYGRGSVVAVWDLENYSVADNSTLDNIQEFLTAKVIETLEQEGGYVIVERQKLLLALEELHLGSSTLADQSSRLQVGRLLGAQLMVFGAFQQAGNQVRVDLRLIEVESGAVIRTGKHASTGTDVQAYTATGTGIQTLFTSAEVAARGLF